jgi:hypothetical protein
MLIDGIDGHEHWDEHPGPGRRSHQLASFQRVSGWDVAVGVGLERGRVRHRILDRSRLCSLSTELKGGGRVAAVRGP